MCLPLYCLHRARQCKVGSPEWRRRQVPSELARLAEYPSEYSEYRQCKVGSPEWRRRQVPSELARLAEYPCESLSLGVVESTPRVPREYPESTPRVPREYPKSTPRVPRECPASPKSQ
jgi:hypothetical protein